MRIAAIDIGTNTVRLLVIRVDGTGQWRELYQTQEITRLGEGLFQSGLLSREAMERTLRTLTHYAKRAASLKVKKVLAMATSAVREAENGPEFVRQAMERTGLGVEVIPAEEEARLALSGVLGVIKPRSRRMLVVDIGGGSTEFILAEEGKLARFLSLKLGVVKIKERFLHHDPPLDAEYRQLGGYIDQELEAVDFAASEGAELVGVAGTATTLAAVAQGLQVYDPAKINNHLLGKEEIETIQGRFLFQTHAQRQATPGLEPKRADVIIAGTALLLAIMEKFGYPACRTCDSGLREGIIQELLARVGLIKK